VHGLGLVRVKGAGHGLGLTRGEWRSKAALWLLLVCGIVSRWIVRRVASAPEGDSRILGQQRRDGPGVSLALLSLALALLLR
jgi:hypothetical protein